MNIRANSSFRAGSFAAVESLIVPKIMAAVTVGTAAVFAESQIRVPVDTGELKASGSQAVAWEGHKVTGSVSHSAAHAAFAEFGVRQRGAAGQWAGDFSYSLGNGYAGFGYVRGSLYYRHPEIKAAFVEAGFVL